MTSLILSTSQEQLLSALIKFGTSPCEVGGTPDLFNLTGYAGCGKTSVLSIFVKELLIREIPVMILAPTHAALGQLRLRLDEHILLTYKTTAAALGQFPVQSNHSTEIKFGGFGGRFFDGVIIIDESSMLGERDVLQLSKLGQKVIFSGDSGQLAPVKKKSGKKALESITNQFELIEVLRSNDIIASESAKARSINQHIPSSSPCGSITQVESEALLLEQFYKTVTEQTPGDVVWITYTNAEVASVNSHTHFLLTGRASLLAGDYVRLGQNCKLGKNNTVVLLDTVEPSALGYIVTTAPSGDGTSYKVEIALPGQYELVAKKIEQLVQQFIDGTAGEAEVLAIESLRSIVPVDFIFAMSAHESQGSSIPYVFANSQRLNSKKAFYVAYSRASVALYCCARIGNTKGVRIDITSGLVWVNKKTGDTLAIDTDLTGEASAVVEAIKAQFADKPEFIPSVSHIACVLNPSHAGKSAKGWVLASV